MAGVLGRHQLSLVDPLGPPEFTPKYPPQLFFFFLKLFFQELQVITHTQNYDMSIKLESFQLVKHQAIDKFPSLPHLASDYLNPAQVAAFSLAHCSCLSHRKTT